MKQQKTASELIAELAADPSYLAMRKARDEEMAKQCVAWAKAEEPLVQALESIGCPVKSVWDLVNTAKPYPEAIPVLVDHLRPAYPSRIKEGIIRALAVPDSRPYWSVLVDLLDTAPRSPDNLRWAAACALSGAADESVIDDVIRIIKDDNLGFDRAPLLTAVARSKDAKAQMLLHELRDHPVLGKEVKKMRRVGRLKTSAGKTKE
ncbi:hypothetical protein KWH01_21245 [Xanthomonas campestris pv. merremiae]|uniref:hypothetical protein n=1 Tax=Xanthomonas citri TaxID=346 RepID=UPI000B5CF4CB|nr:hypothetical protein [Xanthomonas citri]ASK97633.1 hypothetical protein XcvCFBP7112P_16620 [Xanthomonas citri pv. vignicola]MBV6839682.1 hypothetical protein [Xanthomonas campestris pv. merremiae]MBZ3934131.1 hypothetical protein [Xanthomonas campestris pv. merremiae]MCC8567873.1 hypothetical protein [Xanthomonas citri pv. fuscans]